MNTTTILNQALPNYCVLPTQHSHSFPTILIQELKALDEEDEESIFNGQINTVNLEDQKKLISQLQVSKDGSDSLENPLPSSTAAIAKISGKNENSDGESISALESILDRGREIYTNYHQQQLDPYIDAVQVKSRINNKRGARVKALGSPQDHEPNPSYYSKTVHVESSSKEEELDDDDDDHDDGWETDHDDHEDQHDKHHKKGHYSGHDKYGIGKKKKVYKVRAYSGKGKKRKKNNHYYLHGGGKHGASGYGYGKGKGDGKKSYLKKKKVYAPKKKKVAYAYVYKKPKKHYGYHDKHGHGKYTNKHHQHGLDKYKIVHMDHHQLMDHHHKGGKMSIAGLLGYTLLCVNYLLVLKQPTYDKFNSHGYTKYSPHDYDHDYHHGKDGKLVHVGKGVGPILLAHCAKLPSEQSMTKRFVRSSLPADDINNKHSKQVNYFMSNLKQAKKQSNASLEPAESYYHSNDHHHDEDHHHSSALYYLRNNARSSSAGSPPAYYYTLSPSYGSNQHSVGHSVNSYSSDYDTSTAGLLSPIQNYLNRLLMPASISGDDYSSHMNYDDHGDDHHDSYAPIRVVGSPRARLVTNTKKAAALRAGIGGRVVVGADGRSLVGIDNARLIVVDGQPQVVGQRDNLVDLRSRKIDIQMHVIRRKFAGAQQLVNLPEEADFLLARRGNLGLQLPVAVHAPFSTGAGEQMQADQPRPDNNSSSLNDGRSTQILDLPEYSLSGDSIELTCNHRIPISRLYSVKWFKDSLEFYRYIPANGARSKSSLFLPEVRLDLPRSNSQMLYLRNVTHRTSGLYRCEVVSEGPNFETVSGEKRMQVYTLPDSGPQLSLLERAQLPVSNQPPLSPLTSISMITPGQPRRVVQQIPGQHEDTPSSNFLSGFSNTNQQQRDSVSIDGPLVRCSSTRSSPVAQLKFFINNQPVELNRTLENSTVSYSDGTESNVVSFKITLSDFAMFDDDGHQDSALDRAASKKANSSNPDGKPLSLALTLAAVTNATKATSTATTTTPKPNSEQDKRFYANADVQFDDQTVSMNKGGFKVRPKVKSTISASVDKEKNKARGKNKKSKRKEKEKKNDKQSEDNKKKANAYLNDDDEFSSLDDDSDATDESSESSDAPYLDVELHSLPEVEDKTNKVKRKSDLVVGANNSPVEQSKSKGEETESANYKLAEVSKGKANDGRNKREANAKSESIRDRSSYSEASSEHRDKYQSPNNYLSSNSGNNNVMNINELNGGQVGDSHSNRDANSELQSNQEHLRLAKQEQRVRQTNASSNSNRVNNEVYSNYIRIKCTSLVPAVGYEMTSELNVPLTVLVPARQISDALRQPTRVGGEQEKFRLRDFETASRRRQQQDDENANLFGGSRFAIRNGGSLQAPRAVLIDRLAQASSPEPSSGSKTSNPSRNSSSTTTFSSAPANSRSSKSYPKQAPPRNINSTSSVHEQRVKQYQQQLQQSNESESVSNNSARSTLGSISNLGLFRKSGASKRESSSLFLSLFNTQDGSFPYQIIMHFAITIWLIVFTKLSFNNPVVLLF